MDLVNMSNFVNKCTSPERESIAGLQRKIEGILHPLLNFSRKIERILHPFLHQLTLDC
jgi:hypothetical protein